MVHPSKFAHWKSSQVRIRLRPRLLQCMMRSNPRDVCILCGCKYLCFSMPMLWDAQAVANHVNRLSRVMGRCMSEGHEEGRRMRGHLTSHAITAASTPNELTTEKDTQWTLSGPPQHLMRAQGVNLPISMLTDEGWLQSPTHQQPQSQSQSQSQQGVNDGLAAGGGAGGVASSAAPAWHLRGVGSSSMGEYGAGAHLQQQPLPVATGGGGGQMLLSSAAAGSSWLPPPGARSYRRSSSAGGVGGVGSMSIGRGSTTILSGAAGGLNLASAMAHPLQQHSAGSTLQVRLPIA